jgi:hypothetical protein
MKIEIHSVTDKNKKASLQTKMRAWEEQIQKQQRELLVGSGPAPTASTEVYYHLHYHYHHHLSSSHISSTILYTN